MKTIFLLSKRKNLYHLRAVFCYPFGKNISVCYPNGKISMKTGPFGYPFGKIMLSIWKNYVIQTEKSIV